MEQQFSLSWNNFHGNLTNGFSTLLANSEFVDVTLAVDGQLLQAHKIVLSICSPYFKRMFKLNPCQHPIVVLRGVTVKAMRDLLQFIYHGEVSVRQEDLTSFISTAEILQIKGLTNKTADDEGSESGRPTPQNVVSRDARRTPSDSPREAHADSVPPILEQNNIAEHQQQLFNRLAALKRKSDIFQTNIYNNSVVSDAESHSEEKRYKPNGGRRSVALDVHAKLFSYDGANHEPQPTNLCLEHDEPSPSAVDDAHIGDVKTETDEPTYSLTQRRYSDSVLANGTSDEHVRHDADSNGKDDVRSIVVASRNIHHHLPVHYKYIFSRKGHKQLVHMNFVYTKHSTSHGKTSWRCVQYFSLFKCPATVETVGSMIYAVNHQHNHEDCYEKIVKNDVYDMNFSKD